MTFNFRAPALAGLRASVAPLALTLALASVPAFAQTGEEATPEQAPAPAVTDQAPAPAVAEPADPDAVLATVGGEPITEADLLFAAEDLTTELQQIPAAERRAFLLTVLIDMKVMANAAREAELDQTDIFARRLAYLEERSLRRAFFAETIEASVTDEDVEAAYDELVAEFEAQPEVNARHILVETEQEANDIVAEIEGGLAFEEAATEYSLDGSAAQGGDLGYFRTGMMVPEFEEAAFALEEGEMSAPVQSQFGWHIIKLEDRRVSEAPPLEEVRPQVAQQVLYENFAEIVNDLKAVTEIEISDPELATSVEAQGGL